MTAKKKPARVPRTTVTGWGVLLMPWNDKDEPSLLTQSYNDDLILPGAVFGCGVPLMFNTKTTATAWWLAYRENSAWRKTWKVRIVRITGTYEEAK